MCRNYLFIDEAGQVSLANTLAISTSTKNIILIGDQQQLSQPIQGIHSRNSGKSALDFLLGDYDTIPLSRGIFLEVTRRLNEKICKYISSMCIQKYSFEFTQLDENVEKLIRTLYICTCMLW